VKTNNIPQLSKSRFLAGLQCHLRLWYECYNRELIPETPPSQQAIFDTGHQVGRLATRLYPGGVLIEEDHLHHEEAVLKTLDAMANPDISAIYEAAFIYDDIRIRVDILQRLKNRKWNLIEVKSSTSAKDVHIPDVAVQYYVLKGAGLNINKAFLMHLNNQYVYNGRELDLNALFSLSDLTDQAVSMQASIVKEIAGLKEMLSGTAPPEISPSRHCSTPYGCVFFEHCTKDMPEYWVFNLRGITQGKLNDLAAMGINDIKDIPDTFHLSGIQEQIRDCVINNEDYISPDLRPELEEVEYPVHFLDFETVGPAVPRYGGTRPYQTIPFQWSDHILHEDGSIEHKEYLCEKDMDPREEFSRGLIRALGKKGTIFIYTNYETGIIKGLAEQYPQYSDKLNNITERLRDLCGIIKKYYYHPDFQGSFSLKAVLPAIIPEMSYEDLEIQEGNMASLEYLRMIDPSTSADEKERIRTNLLTYCGQDTLAMLRIREELLDRFK
jgi:hypothetical protein